LKLRLIERCGCAGKIVMAYSILFFSLASMLVPLALSNQVRDPSLQMSQCLMLLAVFFPPPACLSWRNHVHLAVILNGRVLQLVCLQSSLAKRIGKPYKQGN